MPSIPAATSTSAVPRLRRRIRLGFHAGTAGPATVARGGRRVGGEWGFRTGWGLGKEQAEDGRERRAPLRPLVASPWTGSRPWLLSVVTQCHPPPPPRPGGHSYPIGL